MRKKERERERSERMKGIERMRGNEGMREQTITAGELWAVVSGYVHSRDVSQYPQNPKGRENLQDLQWRHGTPR